jgi:hypothetical protein
MSRGIVIDINSSSDPPVIIIRYHDSQWRFERYDEAHPVQHVHPTIESYEASMGSRQRKVPKSHIAESFEIEEREKQVRLEKEEQRRERRQQEWEKEAAVAKETSKRKTIKSDVRNGPLTEKKKRSSASSSLVYSSDDDSSSEGGESAVVAAKKRKLLKGKVIARPPLTGRALLEVSSSEFAASQYPDQSSVADESSYLFDAIAHLENINIMLGTFAYDPNVGAERIITSLILSSSNSNLALDALYNESEASFNGAHGSTSSARESCRRLDRFNQRALLFRMYDWLNPRANSAGNTARLCATTRTIQELISKVPRNILDVSFTCDLSHEEENDSNGDLVSDLCEIIDTFLQSRVVPRHILMDANSHASSASSSCPQFIEMDPDQVSSSTLLPSSVPVASAQKPGTTVESVAPHPNIFRLVDKGEKPVGECTMEDLRAMKPRIPLSLHQFKIVSNHTYQRLAGSRERFEGSGGGGKSNETEGNTTFQYGGMNENFVQELVERSCMGKDSSFYDIGRFCPFILLLILFLLRNLIFSQKRHRTGSYPGCSNCWVPCRGSRVSSRQTQTC